MNSLVVNQGDIGGAMAEAVAVIRTSSSCDVLGAPGFHVLPAARIACIKGVLAGNLQAVPVISLRQSTLTVICVGPGW